MKKKVLIVVTNHKEYPTEKKHTGFWLGEVTHFYEIFDEAGYEIDVVSPKGGNAPIDPRSFSLRDQSNKKYYNQASFKDKIENTLSPDQISPEAYEVMYFAGGHGSMWDFPDNESLQDLANHIYAHDGVLAAVCHGVCGLLDVKDEKGELLIKDRHVTGFSNFEEKLIFKQKEVPFLLESQLKTKQAIYQKAFFPFTSYVVTNGHLVTGQNPQSTKAVAKAVLSLLM